MRESCDNFRAVRLQYVSFDDTGSTMSNVMCTPGFNTGSEIVYTVQCTLTTFAMFHLY